MVTKIIWTGTLQEGLAKFNGVMHARLSALTHYTAQSMEAWAKSNAKWQDRTGNARNGLKGEVDITPLHSYSATLSHSVPYGIWLEVRWAGKYGIIMSAIQHESPQVMAGMNSLLGGI